MKTKPFLLDHSSLSCLIAVGLTFLSCGKSEKAPSAEEKATPAVEQTSMAETGEESVDTAMKAPQIAADMAGLIRLQDCPKSYKSLSVTVSDDYTEAKIFSDGELMQTISDPDGGLVATGDDTPVAYMDANFDGYVDIFIGPGESRTYSTLLLWDPDSQQFRRVGTLGDPAFQNIMLHPSGKSLYEGGSMSAFGDYFCRYVWENGELKVVEELTIVYDPEQFGEYEVENVYTLKDANKQTVLSTDDAVRLPGVWKDVARKVWPTD